MFTVYYKFGTGIYQIYNGRSITEGEKSYFCYYNILILIYTNWFGTCTYVSIHMVYMCAYMYEYKLVSKMSLSILINTIYLSNYGLNLYRMLSKYKSK